MTEKLKNLIFLALTAAIILGFAGFELLAGNTAYSYTERRTLAKKPAVTVQTLLNGRFMKDFESFGLDQAPGRDAFRSIKALFSKYALLRCDNNGYFSCDGYLSKLDYPVELEKTDRSLSKIERVYELYLKDSGSRVFFSLIPDKNFFLGERTLIPTIDYDFYVSYLRERLSFAEYIDIFGALSLEDYYFTDQHWRQERILPAAELIAAALGADIACDYEEKTLESDFYGAYVGQSALSFEPDRISYLDSALFASCTVTSYNTGAAKPSYIYDYDKAEGRDAYDFFLSGADALIKIENPNAPGDKKLLVLRDSFASSLAPLLVPGYGEIWLADLRYIRAEMLSRFVDFESQDVLILYSTLVLNSGA